MLFFHELKKVVFSIAFAILAVALVAMPMSQDVMDFSDRKIEQPQPGGNYGVQTKEVPEVIMPAALDALLGAFSRNSYAAYPIGFYKNVKLDDAKQREMAEILSTLTGLPAEELLAKNGQGGQGYTMGTDEGLSAQQGGGFSVTAPSDAQESDKPAHAALKDSVDYPFFKDCMERADRLIGGGSDYAPENLVRFGMVPLTYEEASAQYDLMKQTDRFTGAYARLFSDYLLVGVLSILPVFLSVALCLRDKRARMNGLLYTRRVSSARLVFTRYAAVVTAVMLPTMLLAYLSNASVWGLYPGEALDYLAPLKYTLGWLLPSVMISSAVGMFFTVLTDTPIAVAIQGIWWFVDINLGISEMHGGYSLFRLSPRHNSLRYTQNFIDGFGSLAANRILFAALALALVAATVVVYEQKRRGRFDGYGKCKRFFTGLAHRKEQSAA